MAAWFPARRAALIFIFITVVLDVLAIGIIIPVLPKLVASFVEGDLAEAALIYGIFGTAFAAMQFLFSPVLGALSDRYGRRPVILLSNLGLAFDYVLMALAHTFPLLFIGRLIGGITAASIGTAGAYIADVTPPEKRAAGFGLIGAAFGLGFVIGPALGGILGEIDLRLPFWVAAGLSAANFLYGWLILPESLPPEKRSRLQWRKANPIGALSLLRSQSQVLGLSFVTFFSQLAHVSLPATFVLYADFRYGWDARSVGWTLALVGVCSALVQGLLVRRAVIWIGERRTLLIGLAAGALGFAAYGWAPTGFWFVAVVPLMALWGLAGPSAQALMTQRIDPSAQGRLQGALSSVTGVAGMIGPGLFSQTFAASIAAGATASLPGGAFLLAALLLMIAFCLAWRASRPGA